MIWQHSAAFGAALRTVQTRYDVCVKPRLFLAGFSLVAAVATARAQATNTGSTTKPPDVFLDNHRPLIKKKDRPATSRNVAGKVVDNTGQPLEGALVTLTNTKTSTKTTFITKGDGRYNFEELSLNVDYELQAKYKALTSELRKISQFDPNVATVRILQVDTASAAPSGEAAKDAKTSTAPPQ